jgi:phosphate-selective porin OprO/OprP
MTSKIKGTLVVSMLALGIQPLCSASAESESDNQLADILLKKGTITQQEYNELKEASKDDVHVSTKGGHLKFSSADGRFKFQLGGRLMVDTAAFWDDPELNNGTEVRRARIFIAGEVFNDWKFKLQTDFAGNEVTLKDAWLSYVGFDVADIKVGNFKEPFSLEEMTSSKYITFMERALPNAFVPSRHLGLGVGHYGDTLTAAAGIFGGTVNADNDNGDEGSSLAARVTYSPINEKGRLAHFGVYGEYANPTDDEVRYRERPECHIANVRLVDTGTLENVKKTSKWGLEAATTVGPFSAQGEYIGVSVERSQESDPKFYGWYMQASWFLTGESRPYKKGVYSRVKPLSVVGEGGYGAWELAARLSKIDLSSSGVDGGYEKDFTFGVNWYANPTIRFMANYVNVLDQKKEGVSTKPYLVELRAQIDF